MPPQRVNTTTGKFINLYLADVSADILMYMPCKMPLERPLDSVHLLRVSLTLTVPVTAIDALQHLKQDNDSTVRGDGGSRVGEVRAGTTSPMPKHKNFKLQ